MGEGPEKLRRFIGIGLNLEEGGRQGREEICRREILNWKNKHFYMCGDGKLRERVKHGMDN